MIKELVASLLLSGSIGAKSVVPVSVPVHDFTDNAIATPETIALIGVYNFRDTWSFELDHDYTSTIVFETRGEGTDESPLYSYRCPLSTGDNDYQQLYLEYLDIIYYVDSDDYFDYLDLEFHCYDLYANEVVKYRTIERNDDNSDFTSLKAMMFFVHDSILLHGTDALLFNSLFTVHDNLFTFSYTGYYSFISDVSSIPNKISVYGSCLFNNRLTYGFTNYGYPNSSIGFYMYDLEDNVYGLDTFTLPFNNKVVESKNLLMSSCKMSLDTKTYLENVGVFSYVRDTTYDDATFRDLLFGIVDTPIYFVSSILSFELFGVNLFIALTGLLTLMVILVLIKKFW